MNTIAYTSFSVDMVMGRGGQPLSGKERGFAISAFQNNFDYAYRVNPLLLSSQICFSNDNSPTGGISSCLGGESLF